MRNRASLGCLVTGYPLPRPPPPPSFKASAHWMNKRGVRTSLALRLAIHGNRCVAPVVNHSFQTNVSVHFPRCPPIDSQLFPCSMQSLIASLSLLSQTYSRYAGGRGSQIRGIIGPGGALLLTAMRISWTRPLNLSALFARSRVSHLCPMVT